MNEPVAVGFGGAQPGSAIENHQRSGRGAGRAERACSRRDFLLRAGGLAGAAIAAPYLNCAFAETSAAPRPKVAAIFTEMRFRSHAFDILENFLDPYVFNGRKTDPGMEVVSFYADQFPEKDMARDVSRRYQVPLYPTISEALCRGGKELAADAVLLIGEHGDYPPNELGQYQYPRKEFFDQIAQVVEASGRKIPVFNDKHISYRWDWAKEMYDRARRLGMVLTAGSSVPLAQRTPALEIPAESKITEAVSIHGGGVESYDFHGLEVMQSIVESRRGGETGVASVQFLDGDAFKKAEAEGRWSTELAKAAMNAEEAVRPDPKNAALQASHAILVQYTDGLKGTVLKVGDSSVRWNFACRVGDEAPRATHFYTGPWGNRNLFMALSHAIQQSFVRKEPSYPVERTLLTTGILDAAMHSRHQKGAVIATPQLEFAYRPIDFRAMREMGDSWKVITSQTPEPKEILPGGIARLLKDQ
jgi:hypothetical protein